MPSTAESVDDFSPLARPTPASLRTTEKVFREIISSPATVDVAMAALAPVLSTKKESPGRTGVAFVPAGNTLHGHAVHSFFTKEENDENAVKRKGEIDA